MRAQTSKPPPTFTTTCWIEGAAGFTDSDPNTAPPSAARIARLPSRGSAISGSVLGLGFATFVALADGTTATIRIWWFDDGRSLWVPLAQPANLTYAAQNAVQFQPRHAPGVKLFCQVTANSGVTKIALIVR